MNLTPTIGQPHFKRKSELSATRLVRLRAACEVVSVGRRISPSLRQARST